MPRISNDEMRLQYESAKWQEAKGAPLEPIEKYALDLAEARAALATPPPSNKLRDMKDAPRDGKQILAYWPQGYVDIIHWQDSWKKWSTPSYTFGDDTIDRYKGWLPLPEVSE